MAESSAADKTEQPTPERLQKAREDGNIPQSHEVGGALMVLAILLTLALCGPGFFQWSLQQAQQGLSPRPSVGGDVQAGFASLLRARALDGMLAMAPFLIAAVLAAIAGSLIAGGWTFSPKAVRLDLSRLSPGSGMKNLVSLNSGVQVLCSLAKLSVLTVLVYGFIRDNMGQFMALRWAGPGQIVSGVGQMAIGLTTRVVIALIAIALLELLYQRFSYRRQLRMSRDEVKQERKQHELAPEIRGRIRRIQSDMARKRMLQDVQHADVVLTNPTHVAVALRYDAGKMNAPVVVAKGPDLLGEKIKEIARAHNVPIVPRPELARAIYGTVEIGQAIPETLFVAVAEVLAMIWRLRRQRRGILK